MNYFDKISLVHFQAFSLEKTFPLDNEVEGICDKISPCLLYLTILRSKTTIFTTCHAPSSTSHNCFFVFKNFLNKVNPN